MKSPSFRPTSTVRGFAALFLLLLSHVAAYSATYNWNATANTLSITLGTGESVTVSVAGSNVSFTLGSGTFSQSGANAATGNGTSTITLPSADLATSLTINNSGAGAGTNDVSFNGGTITSTTVGVQITAAGTIGTINFTVGAVILNASAVTMTTNRNVSVVSPGSLEVVNGNLSIEANQQATPTSGNFIGVEVIGGSIKTTGTGTLTVKGRGGDFSEQDGVKATNGGKIEGGTGLVTVVGTGGAASGTLNIGVTVLDTGTRITSSGGDVSVTGTGGGTGAAAFNYGVYVASAGEITAGGSGKVTVQGTGGAGNSNIGVLVLDTDTRITSSGGDVSVTGIEGGGNGGTGFLCVLNGQVTTVPSGGNVTLIANSMNIGAGVSTPSGNSVTLRPYTNGLPIDLGSGSNPIGGPLGLSDTELDRVTTGTLVIGDANTGNITVSAAITRTANTAMQLVTGGDITFNEGINTAGGNLLLDCGTSPKAIYPTFNGTDATIGTLSFGSDLAFILNGNTPGNGSGSTYTQLSVVGSVDLTGVDLVLSGSYVPVVGQSFTIVDNDLSDAITGTFNGLAEGAYVSVAPFTNRWAKISYVGGTNGNDVTLTVVAPDYTITSGADLTITDNAGNGDQLDVTEDGTGINFATTPARTYALNGSATMLFPVTVANVANFNNITLNTGAGNDVNNIESFTAALKNLAINGGTGDDAVNFNGGITFAANANLDVDLQNDDPPPGTDNVTVAANANLVLSGTGTATVKVSKNVLVNSGGSIETVNGNLSIEANQQATPTSGSFVGVEVNGGSIKTTGNGTLTVKGRGGDSGLFQFGVGVFGSIEGGAGVVVVQGMGGMSSGNANHGVTLSGGGVALITSSGGDVIVTGFGGGTGASVNNSGVYMDSGSKIMAGGSGQVSVQGTGGATTGGGNVGILFLDPQTRITSSGGDVKLTGIEGGGPQSIGILFSGSGQITTVPNGGDITLISNSIFTSFNVSTPPENSVTIHPYTNDVQIDLGSNSDPIGGPLGLSVGDLFRITTGTLIIGDNNTGDITVSTAITRSANTNVQLVTGGDITFNEGINTAGGNLLLDCGTSPKAIYPTFNGTDATIGTLSFGSDLGIVINGTTLGTGTGSTYTQLAVVGAVDLTGVDLVLSGSHVPVIGQVFTIVDNDGTDAITGTFTGLPQNSLIANFLGSSALAVISYTGGTGNDVTITVVSPPDYSITTAGNVLTITDNKNNGDVLDITEDGAGRIKFNVTNATRTYDFNGVIFSNLPYTHALTGLNAIVVNTKGGSDIINMGAFANTTLLGLTLNGGTGDDAVNFNGDITFVNNASLDVDLQNDDAPVGVDNVTIAASANLIFSGTGSATVKVSKNVLVNSGGSIETVNGNLTVEANQQAIGTTGGFEGVALDGCRLITRGTGTLTVKGKGGTLNSSKIGVYLYNGGKIDGGSGPVNVTGTGVGAATNNNHGVFVEGANARISSTGGNVSVIGIAGGFGAGAANNRGVVLNGSAQISAGGSGTVTVGGTGGTNAQGINNDGVLIAGNGSKIFSNSGDVSVTGVGGGTGVASRSNYGISLNAGGQISSGGSGTLIINGTGGAGAAATSSNYGVSVAEVNSKIAAGGNLILTGTGGTAGTHNYGVNVADRGQITSNSSGTVGVTGNGGNGQNSYGVFVSNSGSLITSGGGNVTVQGTGGSSGSSQFGVYAFDGGSISAGGMGNLSVTGTAGATSGFTKYGVYLNGNGANITSGGGNVTVTGIEGGTGAGTGYGFVNETTGAITTATNGGNITVIANSMLIVGPISTNAAGQTTLRQNTNNVAISLGDFTDTKGGPLQLSDTELDWVTTGTLVIGNANSGDIFVSAAITRSASTSVQLVTGGDITFNQGINTAGGNLLLDCGTTPKAVKPTFNGTDATVGTLSFGSDLAFVLNGTTPGDGSGSTYTQLKVVGSVDLTGVDLVLNGSYVPVAGQSFTIVDNDLSDAITGTFNGLAEGASIANFLGSTYKARITYLGGSNNNDVVLTVLPADYSITTGGGNLVITDLAGNGDQLDVTQNGMGIQFATTPARTYSLDGAAPAAFPVTIANVATFNNITINTGAGNDVNNIGAFTAALKNLTINGGTGNDAVNFNGDITFVPNANLDVDLQNDDATPGTDNVTVAANANLVLSGTGTATVKVSKNVLVNSGGSIETVNGNLLVEANQQGTVTTGAFSGVTVTGAGSKLGCSGSGILMVKGKGGNSGQCYGVVVEAGGIITGGTAAVSVMGTGGSSTSNENFGVFVTGANSKITSSGGDVSVTGQGGGKDASGFNIGVYVGYDSQITAGASGQVTVQGTGGASSGDVNGGVWVETNALVTSSGGNVNVTGHGGGSGTSGQNEGILVQNAGQITAGGSGTVTVTGNGGTASTGGADRGVTVLGSDSKITSSGGNVSVTGTGGGLGSSSDNYGVFVVGAGQITAGNSGTVTVLGNGGTAPTGNSNIGVFVNGTDSKITSSGGNVSVTGTGGGSGAGTSNHGIYVQFAGQITAGGSGSVTIVGNGGTAPTGNSNYGVYVSGTNSSVTSSGGNVSVTGTGGGTGASRFNIGIIVESEGEINASNNGTVTVVGNGGTASSGVGNIGVYLVNTNSKITSSGGHVNVTGTGGGSGTSSDNHGIFVTSASQITAGGNGTVTVVGNGGAAPTGGSNHGVFVTGANSKITSSGNVSVTGVEGGGPGSIGYINNLSGSITTLPNGGNITLTANSMRIGGGVSTPMGNNVTLRPYTNGVQIDLGSATDPTGGPLGLSDAELDQITTGTLNIGDANTGDITVSAPITRPASTVINLTTGGAANLNASALNSAGGNVNLNSAGGVNPSATGVDVNAGGVILDFTAGNDLNIAINGTAVDAQYRQLNVVGKVDITGVDLVFSGSYIVDDCETYTIINNDGADAIVGTFTGLPEGATIPNFRGSGLNATITYIGGNGNDVVIDVPDITPPTITCPDNRTVNSAPNQCNSSVQTYTVVANDNCGSATTTQPYGLPSTTTFPSGTTINVFTATDGVGLTATCSFTITVVDNQKPSIVCPANQVKTTDANQCTAVVIYPNPTFSDNCGGAYLIRTSGPASGGVFPKGITMVNWVATDASGNSAICGFTVTVSDGQAPTITCPVNLVKGTDAGQCTAVTTYTTPVFTDNCTGASAALFSGLASGSTFQKGVNTVVWKVTDGAGLAATCAFTVTVNDNQAPVVTCPGNQTKNTDAGLCTAVATYPTPTFTDNCVGGSVTIQSGLATGSAFPKGLNTVVWRATDAAGLTKTCTFRVTVNDAQTPTITCPANQAKTTDAGLCTAIATYNLATFTDNCAGGSVVKLSGLNSGSAFPRGVNNVVFRATDAAGNQSLCSITITVTDAQLPTVSCPANIVVTGTTANGICSATVTYTNPTASDNCGLQSSYLLNGLASGSVFPQGVTTNVWKATDEGGLTATCAFTVTVSCGTNSSLKFEVRSSKLEVPAIESGYSVNMRLAPNPASTELQISIEGLPESGGQLTVFDAQGRVVWQQSSVQSPTTSINVSDLPSGLYQVRLQTEHGVVTKGLVVNRL